MARSWTAYLRDRDMIGADDLKVNPKCHVTLSRTQLLKGSPWPNAAGQRGG